jgi:putative exosortase-associated protein (TIGR04073 family)
MMRVAATLSLGLALFLCGCAGMEPREEIEPDHWSRNPAAVPFMKIGRGTVNIVASPLDIPATIVRVTREEDNVGYGLAAGTAEGAMNFLARAGMGVVEILTFPLVNDPDPLYERDLGQRAYHKKPDVTP